MASGSPQYGAMSGVVKISQGDEKQLMEAVATVGPVAAVVDATSNSFRVGSYVINTAFLRLQGL